MTRPRESKEVLLREMQQTPPPTPEELAKFQREAMQWRPTPEQQAVLAQAMQNANEPPTSIKPDAGQLWIYEERGMRKKRIGVEPKPRRSRIVSAIVLALVLLVLAAVLALSVYQGVT